MNTEATHVKQVRHVRIYAILLIHINSYYQGYIIEKRVSNFHMLYLSTVKLNGFLQRIVNWCLFYNMQALIDIAECTITCISIIMDVNLYATSMPGVWLQIFCLHNLHDQHNY